VHRFWDTATRPLLAALEPRAVVEIGAARGLHTRLLAEWCRDHASRLRVIDPKPRFDPSELADPAGLVVVDERMSLAALPETGPVDLALLDGDHNWYTVVNELRLLQQTARQAGRPSPVMMCHDVCWPYGRRDIYYDPESIPPEHRQPWQRAGVLPDRDALVPDGGLNPHLCNAVHEGGRRNGVMTAVEDFALEAGEPLSLTVLPVLYGLAILVPESRLEARPALARRLGHWETAEGWADLARLAERHRRQLDLARQAKARERKAGKRARAAPSADRGTSS
jgi:Methyltransferase domain